MRKHLFNSCVEKFIHYPANCEGKFEREILKIQKEITDKTFRTRVHVDQC